MIQRIVVGIDFSPSSRAALRVATEWAQRLGVPLLALHVIQELPFFDSGEFAMPAPEPSWFQDMERLARGRLDAWLEVLPRAEGRVTWGRRPADALLEAADEDSLLVLGRTGQGAVARLLFGSTAQRAAAEARGPVLLTPAVHSA